MEFTKGQKKKLRALYEKSRRNEMEQVMKTIKKEVDKWIQDRDPEEAWERIRSFVFKRTRDMNRKYDFRYSVIIRVLATQYVDGYLSDEELESLDEAIRSEITGLAELQRRQP